MKNQKLKGNFMILLSALICGISFVVQSKGVEQIPPMTFNGIRSLLGGFALLPIIYFIDKSKRKKGISVQPIDKSLIKGSIICGVFLCAGTTLQTTGLVYTSPGKAGFITALYMVIIPIINLFFGKKPRLIILVSVFLAVMGLYLMCIQSSLALNFGDLLILMCSFVFAGHILVIDHYSSKVDGVKLSCGHVFVCGIINIMMALLFEKPSIAPLRSAWGTIAYSGIMSCSVAYTLQIVGQRYTDPTSTSIFMSLESVFATLSTVILVALGWNITGGAMTMREILGCVLMFIAIILVQLPKKSTNIS